MALTPTAVGMLSNEDFFEYDWKSVALYALGVGAGQDELDLVYEGRGPRVLPTFAVVPALHVVEQLVVRSGGDPTKMVHGAQALRLHGPLPSAGRLRTTGRVAGLHDLKRMAQLVIATETWAGDELLAETEWSLIFLGAGGFGGPAPRRAGVTVIPDGALPVWTQEMKTTPQQALLYRLSGDLNPLHADPEFAAQLGFTRGPILHGLCTFGVVARAVIGQAGGDPRRLRSLTAQFRKPVWPGETLRVSAFEVDSCLALRVAVVERDEAVLGNCVAEVSA